MPLLLLLALFGCAAPDTVAVSERGSLSRGSDVNSASSGAPPMALLAATTSLLVGDSATVSVRDPLAGEYARRRMFGAATTVSYRVSDTAVVRVAPTGTVYALRAGEAWLHASLREWSDSTLFSISSPPDSGGAAPPPPPPGGDPQTPPPGGQSPDGVLAKAAELPRRQVELPPDVPAKRILLVSAGGNLQAALDSAQPGDHVVLARGAVFTGQYFLRKKAGNSTDWITIRSDGPLPPKGVRVTPATAASFATVQASSGGSASAFRTDPGASRYHLVALNITRTDGPYSLTALVSWFSGNPKSLDEYPNHIAIDRSYIHGIPGRNVRICVRMTGQHLALIDSYVAACHDTGFEAQGVESFGGDGPLLIHNNYVEGAGQGVFLSVTNRIPGDLPTDVTITRNHFYKPPEWYRVYLVKNVIEFKGGRRVLIEENYIENNWAHGQTGYAFVIKAGEAYAEWSVTEDVTIRRNVVDRSHLAFNITSAPNTYPTEGTRRVTMEDNLFYGLGQAEGSTLMPSVAAINSSPDALQDFIFRRNSVVVRVSQGSFAQLDGPTNAARIEITRNVFTTGLYGIKGNAKTAGKISLDHFWPTYRFSENLLIGTPAQTAPYPAGNFGALSSETAGLDANDAFLVSSPFSEAKMGFRIGAPIEQLEAMVRQVRSPR